MYIYKSGPADKHCAHSTSSEWFKGAQKGKKHHTPLSIGIEFFFLNFFFKLKKKKKDFCYLSSSPSPSSSWTFFNIFFRGCTSGGVYIPCIYTHAR